MSKESRLAKNTIIFALGNLGTKLISFLFVPLYTNVLSTSEYGTVDLFSTIAMFVIPVVTLNIVESPFRACFLPCNGINRGKVI